MTEQTPEPEVADATSPDDIARLEATVFPADEEEAPQDATDLGTDQDGV